MPFWEEIEAHIPNLYRYLLCLTRDTHIADDMTQETILRAWKKLDQLKKETSFKAWIFQIARNLAADEHRASHRLLEFSNQFDPIAPETSQPDRQAMLSENQQRLHSLIMNLPGRQSEVMYLHAIEGLQLSEIAKTLNISRNSAKVSLCLARQKLRSTYDSSQTPSKFDS